jgi:hypothetical protein
MAAKEWTFGRQDGGFALRGYYPDGYELDTDTLGGEVVRVNKRDGSVSACRITRVLNIDARENYTTVWADFENVKDDVALADAPMPVTDAVAVNDGFRNEPDLGYNDGFRYVDDAPGAVSADNRNGHAELRCPACKTALQVRAKPYSG